MISIMSPEACIVIKSWIWCIPEFKKVIQEILGDVLQSTHPAEVLECIFKSILSLLLFSQRNCFRRRTIHNNNTIRVDPLKTGSLVVWLNAKRFFFSSIAKSNFKIKAKVKHSPGISVNKYKQWRKSSFKEIHCLRRS